jgi:hypothetical protein
MILRLLRSLFRRGQERRADLYNPIAVKSGQDLSVQVNEPDSDLALRITIEEVNDLRRAVRELSMSVERFINFAGLIAAGAITYGVISQAPPGNGADSSSDTRGRLVLIFAPYALALVYGYIIQIYTDVEVRASLKDHLEREINEEFERRLTTSSPSPNSPTRAILVLNDSIVNSEAYRGRLSVRLVGLINAGAFFSADVLQSDHDL